MEHKFTPEQEAWLAALESGEYQQCRGALKKSTDAGASYCCLGVAAEVLDAGGYREDVNGNWVHRGAYAYLTEKFENKLGLRRMGRIDRQVLLLHKDKLTGREHDVLYKLDGADMSSLVNVNDHARMSFREIAALIRKVPDVFFK